MFRYNYQPVATKVIKPETTLNVSPAKKKFEREITMLSGVKHGNIGKLFATR